MDECILGVKRETKHLGNIHETEQSARLDVANGN